MVNMRPERLVPAQIGDPTVAPGSALAHARPFPLALPRPGRITAENGSTAAKGLHRRAARSARSPPRRPSTALREGRGASN